MNGIRHFVTITKHKMLVMNYCFQVGLYKQGLLHDLSKYAPVEFSAGARFYQGDKSPNSAQKERYGYSVAWLHHKGRNKHHFEYWIDYGLNPLEGLQGHKMPTNYVVEMFMDRIAACKVYLKDAYNDESPLNYFVRGKEHYVMHKDSMELLEKLLVMLAKDGEKKTFHYIKHYVLKHKKQ